MVLSIFLAVFNCFFFTVGESYHLLLGRFKEIDHVVLILGIESRNSICIYLRICFHSSKFHSDD